MSFPLLFQLPVDNVRGDCFPFYSRWLRLTRSFYRNIRNTQKKLVRSPGYEQSADPGS